MLRTATVEDEALVDRDYVELLLRRLEGDCPHRAPASADERRAQGILAEELQSRGLTTEFQPFQFNRSLCGVIVAHLVVGLLGSMALLIHPLIAAPLHFFAALSYFCDSTYRGFLLRRLFPKADSQNLIATLPAATRVRKRIVFLAHADAAYTGWLFNPTFIKRTSNGPILRTIWPLRKHLMWAVVSLFLFAILDVCFYAFKLGYTPGFVHHMHKLSLPSVTPWTPDFVLMPGLYIGVSAGMLLCIVLNLNVVWRSQVVPGANDNLTGCVALPVLAERLALDQPKDVEYVFVVTGCEEAGCGGAHALFKARQGEWDRFNTVVIGLDSISGGALRYHQEGEVVPMPVAPWLRRLLRDIARTNDRFKDLAVYHAPAGKTDVAPCLQLGYHGVCLANIDLSRGVPDQYHQMTDTADNVNYDQLLNSIDLAETITKRILGTATNAPHSSKRNIAADNAGIEIDVCP